MTYPDANVWTGEAPEPRLPEVAAEFDPQWVDFSDDLEQFEGMGTCSLRALARLR